MNENEGIPSNSRPRRQPWNKGKLIGAKPPLRASHVWSIRTTAAAIERLCSSRSDSPTIIRPISARARSINSLPVFSRTR